jgi:hypothetical protein
VITVVPDFIVGCALLAALAWALALVARADRGFHFRGPAVRPLDLRPPALPLLGAHAQAADQCDACQAAPWDCWTREAGYLCRACACRVAEQLAAEPRAGRGPTRCG